MTISEEVNKARVRAAKLLVESGQEIFDHDNSQNDWVAYICAYAGRAAQKVVRNDREGCTFRQNMLKVAGLAMDAIAAYDKGWC